MLQRSLGAYLADVKDDMYQEGAQQLIDPIVKAGKDILQEVFDTLNAVEEKVCGTLRTSPEADQLSVPAELQRALG
jgi:hypothetical protein